MDTKEEENLTRLANEGDPEAQVALSITCASAKQWGKVRQLLTSAAVHGHAEAQARLGVCLLIGQFGEREPRRAVEWFQRAAVQDHPLALANLGLLSTAGDFVPRDIGLAYRFLYRAALRGNPQWKQWYRSLPELVPADELEQAKRTLRYPDITLWLGPPVEGHLNELFDRFQIPENLGDPERPASEEITWESYERDVARAAFGSEDSASPRFRDAIFSALFGESVTVGGEYFFGVGYIRGKRLATLTWSLAEIVCSDGMPVAWPPDFETAEAETMTRILALLNGRQWVWWNVSIPEYLSLSEDVTAS